MSRFTEVKWCAKMERKEVNEESEIGGGIVATTGEGGGTVRA